MKLQLTEENLIENQELRERVVERVEVLDHVKQLFMLPQLNLMTMQQVSDYYEVDKKVIEKCFERNRKEFESDGASRQTYKSLLEEFLDSDIMSEPKSGRGWKEFRLNEDTVLRVPNCGMIMFPKRAVLRFGMLLRDSEIAREVRTQLLNVFENASQEEQVFEIDKEMSLYYGIAEAYATGDPMKIMMASLDLDKYRRRHIEALETDNKMLATEILTWDDRACVNRAIRLIANRSSFTYGNAWKALYDELRYKHGIGLSQRGDKPLIQHVREDEWPAVQSSLAAICEMVGLSPSYIFEKAKIST